jgi:hypothetical protein
MIRSQSIRALTATLVLASASVVSVPSAQGAGSGATNPFSPGLGQPGTTASAPSTSPPPVTVAPTTTTAGSGGGFSGGTAVAVGIGALVILGGISAFIWYDARRRAPVRSGAGALAGIGGARSGSKARAKPRKPSPAERRRRKRGRAR